MTLTPIEAASLELEQAYALVCATPSDIHQHLPALRWLATDTVDHDNLNSAGQWRVYGSFTQIVEFGVRSVVSTWAMLAARPQSMLSVDIERHGNVDVCEAVCRDAGQPWEFRKVSTLDLPPVRCAMLFIDTLHTYAQLRAELERHAGGVTRCIALHDTETFGERGMDEKAPGLKAALNEFLAGTKGRPWEIAAHFTHNNGLTVLRRR